MSIAVLAWGFPIPMNCPRCGTPTEPARKSCPNCGARAEERVAEAPERPARRTRLSRGTVIAAFVLAVIVGMPASCIGEDIAERPAWGSLLCPHVCADCRGPGRTVIWRSSRTGDHSVALCHNPRVDVEKVHGSEAEKYGEITLSWWWRTPLTILCLTVAGLVVIGVVRRRAARA